MKPQSKNILNNLNRNAYLHGCGSHAVNAGRSALINMEMRLSMNLKTLTKHNTHETTYQVRRYSSSDLHQFETDLMDANVFHEDLEEKQVKRLEEIFTNFEQNAQGYYSQTLDTLLTLYEEKVPINTNVATSILESFFNCKRFDVVEYFFHKWFNNSIYPKPYTDRSWMKYIVGMYAKNEDAKRAALLKEMIQNAQQLLPQEQKFRAPKEEDYMLLLTAYSKMGDVNKFMEARAGMKKDLNQDDKDEPWVVACSLTLLKESGNREGALKVFETSFDSSLFPNPGLPPPTLKEYTILMSIFSARGDMERCKEIFAAAEADIGSLDSEYRMLTLLIRAYTRNTGSDYAWILYKRYFRTFETDEENNKLFPDAPILSILLGMYTRAKDKTMIQRLLNISTFAMKEDNKRRRSLQESTGSISQEVTNKIDKQSIADSLIGPRQSLSEDLNEEYAYDEEEYDLLNDGDQIKGFKLDFMFSTTYIKACLTIEKPEIALDHFKRYYNSSISINPDDPLLLLPTLGFYGRLMHEFLFTYHPKIVEQLYMCAVQDFPIETLSKFAPINHAILILYLRESRYDEMMTIFEERFRSSLSENSKNNPLILKSYAMREIMVKLLQENRIDDLYAFLDIMLRDRPRRDPVAMFIHLLDECLEKKYNLGALLDYFLLKTDYENMDDAHAIERILNSKFASQLGEGNVNQIITWFSQMPLHHQVRPRLASIYISALLRASTLQESWNEFIRLFKLPIPLKPMPLPYVTMNSESTTNARRSSPDDATYSVMLNAFSSNGSVEICKQLLECAKIDTSDAYTRLYHYYLLALLNKGDYEKISAEMQSFYTNGVKPPAKLLKEIIFECPSVYNSFASYALELYEKYYPKDHHLPKLRNAIRKRLRSSSTLKDSNSLLSASEEKVNFESLPEEERQKMDNIIRVVVAYIEERNFEMAIQFLPLGPESSIKIRREDYATILQAISRSGNIHNMKEILIHAKLDGYSAVVFAFEIVMGLLEGNMVREAVAFFKKLYQTSLGPSAPNATRPPREIYITLIRSLRKLSYKDEGMTIVLNQVQKSFNNHYPPILSRKGQERVKERLEQV